MQEEAKTHNKTFFKIFAALFIINAIASITVYFIAPDQIPSKLSSEGFTNYKNKISLLAPIIISLVLLSFVFIFHNVKPSKGLFFGNTKQLMKNNLKFVLGERDENLNIDDLYSKFMKVIILVAMIFLIPFNFILLCFALKYYNIENIITLFLIIFIIVVFPLCRVFSKILKQE